MKSSQKLIFHIFFILLTYLPCHASIKPRGKDAFIHVASGANFVIDQTISNYGCSLIRDIGGIISGQEITFQDGIFEDAGNELRLSAIFNPSGTLTLDGSNRMRAYSGEILQSIIVNGINNSIEGVPRLTGDLILQDINTTVSIAVQNDLSQNIVMNGGTIILQDNLSFGNNFILTGSGTVDGAAGFIVQTGAKNFTWNSDILWKNNANISLRACQTDFTGVFTFRGQNSINGNGNVLQLGGGEVVVEANSTLFLSDLVLKGLGNTAGKFTLLANSSAIKMSNVDLEFIDDLTTSQGSIYIKGPATVILKNYNWMLDGSSSMTVDGVSLYIDPAGSEVIGEIMFDDEENQLDLLNTGTIKIGVLAVAAGLPARVSRLESCCDMNISMIDMLKTSTGTDFQSDIDNLTSMVDMLKVSTGQLQSQIDVVDSKVDSTQMFAESCCDDLQSQIDGLGSDTDGLQSQIDSNVSMINMIKTSTGELQIDIDVNASMIDMIKTSTGQLQSEIDAIDSVASMVDMLKVSTGQLQLQIDILSTSTTFLAEQLDQIQMFTYQVILDGISELPPFALLCEGLKLQDSSVTTTLSIPFPVGGEVHLNGGTIVLHKDLTLQNNSTFVGGGTVVGNGQRLYLGRSIVALQELLILDNITLSLSNDIDLTTTLIFKNNSTFDASTHMIDMFEGYILADQNTTLHMHQALLANVIDNHISCMDDTGKIILDDVIWSQGGNSEFTQGALEIRGNTSIQCFRGSTLSYRTTQTCTITTQSTLTLDDRLTFSYDPINSDPHLIEFESSTSILQLAGGALLHVTLGGLQLRGGNFFVLSNSRMASEVKQIINIQGVIQTTDNGITFGNRNSTEDIRVLFDANAQLTLLTGSINYKNMNVSSWEMLDDRSRLQLSDNTILRLFESMNLNLGNIITQNAVKIAFASGRVLTGPINPFGSLFKTVIVE